MNKTKVALIGSIVGLLIIVCVGVGVVVAGDSQANNVSSDVEQSSEIATKAAMPSSFWALVCGNDTRLGTVEIEKEEYKDGNARADTILLVHVDTDTKKIALVSVPRDTATTINGQTVKINEAYRIGGMSMLIDEVEKLTGVKASYYMNVNFVQYEKLIEGLGGHDGNVPIDMSLQDIVGGSTIELKSGEQHLNGAQSLVLARTRKLYADDLDACRQIQNRQILQRVITKLTSNPDLIDTVVDLAIANSDTNFDADSLKEVAKTLASASSDITFTSGTGPYKGGAVAEAGNLWLATRDEQTWKSTIEVALAGGDMNSVYADPVVAAKK